MSTIESETQKPEKKSRLFWLEKLGMKTHNRKFWNSDKFLSLFAFLISVGTFATFAYQTYLIREQQDLILKEQYASVLPYLTIYSWYGGQEDFSINLINNGVGPAFIQDVKIYYEEETYNLHPREFVSNIISPNKPINISGMGIAKGAVIPAGREYKLVGSNDAKVEDLLRDLFSGSDPPKVQIEITYSSVYEETWIIKSFSYVPEKVE